MEHDGELPPRVDCELMNHFNIIIGFANLLAESESLDGLHRRYAAHIAASGARASATIRTFFKNRPSDSWRVIRRPV